MTAILAIRDGPAAHLVTDLGVFDDDGKFIGENTKVIHLVHLNAAVALRGAALHIAFLRANLSACGPTFEDLRRRAPEAGADVLNTVANLLRWSAPALQEFECIVAGINLDGEADSFMMASHSRCDPPFTVIDLQQVAMLPKSDLMTSELKQKPAERTPDGAIDIDRLALRAMEAQRRERTLNAAGKLASHVGGGI